MTVARVFKSGNSQAVRLPKEFRFNSDEVEIFRRGDEVVLREKPKTLEHVFDLIADLDFLDELAGDRGDTPPQEREGL